MHILLFYQYYHSPDCAGDGRLYAFLRRWGARHRITVLTSRAWFDRRLSDRFAWTPPNVELIPLDAPYDNAMDARRRLQAFARYAGSAVLRGLSLPKPDVILGVSTPLTAAWAAATTARLRRVPWVFEVQDLWPDFPVQMGAVRRPFLQRRLYGLERRLYNAAAHVVTLSPDMTDHVRRLVPEADRVSTLLNGTDFWLLEACADERARALREAHGLAGKRLLLYAGTFGRANGIPTLLEAARLLRHRADVQWVFLGRGFFLPALRDAAARHPNVTVITEQPRHDALHWFRLADLSLAPFIDLPVLATNSPTKLFDSLGAGTPVVVTNPGWTKRFVEEHRCGWYAPPSDADALARCLDAALADPAALAAAGRRGAAVARRLFDRDAMADRFEALLLQAAGHA